MIRNRGWGGKPTIPVFDSCSFRKQWPVLSGRNTQTPCGNPTALREEGFLLGAMILQSKMDGDVFEGKTVFYDHDKRQLVTRTRWLGVATASFLFPTTTSTSSRFPQSSREEKIRIVNTAAPGKSDLPR